MNAALAFATKKHKFGIAARFVKINKTTGFKAFENENECRENFDMQAYANRHRLGPRCWDVVPVKYEGNIWYGFHTQFAYTLTNHLKKHGLWKAWIRDELEDIEEYNNLILGLENSFYNVGVCPVDLHSDNVGYLPNGSFVAIDFSEFVFSGE